MSAQVGIHQAAGVRPVEAAEELPGAVFGRRNLLIAALLFTGAIVVPAVVRALGHHWLDLFVPSDEAHYVYQAYSFLHGRLDIDLPATKVDVIAVHGKDYIVYPPFPAILMMPFVALWGLGTSDVLFTLVVAALGLSTLFLLLEQLRANGWTKRTWRENLVITLLLFYGSIALWLSVGGRMWFTGHIVAFTCGLLSLLLAFRRHYTWAAVLMACAFFSRPTDALGLPFIFYLAWDDAGAHPTLVRFLSSLRRRAPDWTALPWRRLAGPAAVVGVMVGLYLLHNYAIFGSPLETGYDVLLAQHYPMVEHGPFDIRYVPPNIIANFFTFPVVTFTGPFDRHPTLDMLNHGFAVSVFVTTPLFLFLFARNQKRSALRVMLWVTIALMVAAVLVFHASGWRQFGARYLFEAYPFAFILLALNEIRLDWRFIALGLLGIVINILGAIQFWGTGPFPL